MYQLARACSQKRPCFKSRNSTPQHSIERDVDLPVVIECLKIADILRSKQANTHRDLHNILKLLSSRQHEQRP